MLTATERKRYTDLINIKSTLTEEQIRQLYIDLGNINNSITSISLAGRYAHTINMEQPLPELIEYLKIIGYDIQNRNPNGFTISWAL